MQQFKNILIGVDLCSGDCLASDVLGAPTAEAIDQALWLAQTNDATLLFFYALDVAAATHRLIEESPGAGPTVMDDAREVLGRLVNRASQAGVTAQSMAVYGKSWLEMIRQVHRANHDLVVVGTRSAAPGPTFLVGSTGIKLLRKCPCPVWITKPKTDCKLKSILVAHDLSPVGDRGVELGCSMAELHDAKLHIVHAVQFAHHHRIFRPHLAAEEVRERSDQAKRHIDRQLRGAPLKHPAEIHIVEADAAPAILAQIHAIDADLLIMGTISHFGIPGVFTGSTAERVLPQLPCSLLAIKPAEFQSPITAR